MKNTTTQKRGFTLIEIIVATSIFTIVMLIAIGAVLSAVDANRKAQNTNVIVNNLNLAIESMVRDLRTGKNYGSCGSDCVQFTDKDGRSVQYSFSVTGGIGGVYKSITGGGSTIGEGRITSEEVDLENVSFNIQGEGSGDGPERILVQVKGSAGGTSKVSSEFNIQTLVTSRSLDEDELN